MSNSQSTVTLQNILDINQSLVDAITQLNVGGTQNQPFLTCCNDTMNAICAVNFPHKWNEIIIPPFYTSSLQQDYAVVTSSGASIINLSWLERGVAIAINESSNPKPYRFIEVGRQLPQQTGSWYNFGQQQPLFTVNWFPNNNLYYGVWGSNDTGNPTFGNNPGPGSIYTSPIGISVSSASWAATAGGQITFVLNYLPNTAVAGTSISVSGATPTGYNGTFTIVSTSGTSVIVTAVNNPGAYQAGGIAGAPASMPANPITQIQDANGNLLLLTRYGKEGTAAPLATSSAAPGTVVSGTGATTQWTVVDPQGYGFRILPVPNTSGVVWQINLVGQMKPVRFTSLGQTLYPLPDEYETHFRDGVMAQLYKYSPLKEDRAKFPQMWALWKASLVDMRARQDRELEENMFTLNRGIMSRGNRSAASQAGPAWPFLGGSF
jgi:hypothetical protein